jgi:hypothetical protein
LSNSAVVMPVIPPPMTATSTVALPSSDGYGEAGGVSDQTEFV